MPQEIERKFIVKGAFKQDAYRQTHIVQGYLNSAPERTVRIRIQDEAAFLTIKGKSNLSGTSRYEWEKQIPLEAAKELLGLCEPGIIEKTRYCIRQGEHTIEVDEFHGDNSGLVMAEIELGSENERFDPPAFFGKEVTGDVRYYNSYLKNHPYNSWNSVAAEQGPDRDP